MRNKSVLLVILVATLILSACKKDVLTGGDTSGARTLVVDDFDFDYLSTRSKIRFQDDDNSISLNANIRIKKDSIIWLSLSPGLGIEAARGVITQDSMVIINRINKEFMVFDFKTLSEKYNFDINFSLIQAMLLGNMPLPQRLGDDVSKKESHFIIRQTKDNINIENYINALSHKTERVQLSDQPSDNTLTLIYSDYQALADDTMPFSNKIILNYLNNNKRLTALIDIDHGKAEVADASLGFPFNIPQKYERK